MGLFPLSLLSFLCFLFSIPFKIYGLTDNSVDLSKSFDRNEMFSNTFMEKMESIVKMVEKHLQTVASTT